MLSREEQERRIQARHSLVQNSGHVGNRLRWLRAERDLRSVSKDAGLSKSRLSQLENCAAPGASLKSLFALQLTYGCSSLNEMLGPLASWEGVRAYHDA